MAEIYVDNIKHSSYDRPPGATLVEKPMIFIAPLQGEVGDQLIVSPISTMVYRSMQANGTSFEVAKESVANELGVSSDILLTNYNVENPSSDHISMQERSDDEIEKLGLSMTYRNNYVYFVNEKIQGGKYVVKDYWIPSAQDPDHHIRIGTVVKISDFNSDFGEAGQLDFVLGREGTYDAATWWRNRVSSDQNNYNSEPDKLNFAMRGDLTLNIDGEAYLFTDFFIAQGHNLDGNNWWIGSRECWYIGNENITCNSKDESGNTVKFEFNGNDQAYYFDVTKVD